MLNRKFLLRLALCLIVLMTITGGVFAQDRDGDGVGDSRDRCPSVAGPGSNGGCPVNSGGGNNSSDDSGNGDSGHVPPPDSDGDGTADPLDHCPTLPGDGANYGCPEGMTSEDAIVTATPDAPFILIPIPDDGACSISPAGNYRVNVREYPDPNAPIVGVLNPNIPVPVGAILNPNGAPITTSELEPEGNQIGPWFLPVPDDGGEPGWVAGDVIQFGGADCDNFNPTRDTAGEPYLKYELKNVLISSYSTHSTSGHGGEIEILSWSWGATNPVIEINALVGEVGDDDVVPIEQLSLNFTKIEFEYNPQVPGDFMLTVPDEDDDIEIPGTNDDGSTTIEYCTLMEVKEAGVFEEVCYEIEIPENCTVTAAEAGVYHIECEEEAHIAINPALDGLPAVDLYAPGKDDDAILIGLLLPAVQKVRGN